MLYESPEAFQYLFFRSDGVDSGIQPFLAVPRQHSPRGKQLVSFQWSNFVPVASKHGSPMAAKGRQGRLSEKAQSLSRNGTTPLPGARFGRSAL